MFLKHFHFSAVLADQLVSSIIVSSCISGHFSSRDHIHSNNIHAMTNPSCPLMDSWACGLVPGAGSCLWLWGATRQSFPVMWHCIKLLFKLFTIMLCSTTQQPYHHIRDLIWWYNGLRAKFNILPYTFHRHQTPSICNVWLRKMDPMTFEIA